MKTSALHRMMLEWCLERIYLDLTLMMLRPISPELVFFLDFWVSNIPRCFCFCFLPLPMYHCRWTNCPRGYLSGSYFVWMSKNVDTIVDGTSPTIKRSRNGMSPDTGMSVTVGIPHIALRVITKLSYVVSDDNTLWYRNADRFIEIKPCKVKVLDVLKDHKFAVRQFTIRSSSYSYETVFSSIEHATRLVRIYLDLTFCWCYIPRTSTSGYYFGHFLKQAFQSCHCVWLHGDKKSPIPKNKICQ